MPLVDVTPKVTPFCYLVIDSGALYLYPFPSRILSGMKQIEQAALGSNDAPSQTIDGNTTISSSSNGSKSPLSSLIPRKWILYFETRNY